jgi:beta-galactosidase
VSGGVDGDPGGELRFSRRSLLRAGALGAAALTGAVIRRPRGAQAAETGTARAAPGVYTLNQGWLFGGAYVAGSEASGYSESGFDAVTLPHTVTPLSWGDWDPGTWQQAWVYRKHLAGAAVSGSRVFLDFDGVMTSATVYVGGKLAAQHQGGYLPFSVELTPFLAPGDNVVAVVADGTWQDVPPDGAAGGPASIDYLQPAGIYRDVRLRVVPAIYVSDVFAKPIGVLSGTPAVQVQFTIDATAAPAGPVALTATVSDGATALASATGSATVTGAGTSTATVTVSGLSGITLWSPDTPKLYTVTASMVADGVTHTQDVTIGFRQVSFTTSGFYLNGQRLEIFGLNRHQLYPYAGMAVSARLQRRDAELLRNELRCNMVRCSHYPQSPDFLDACDELGLMVWEETPGWQYLGDKAFQNLVLQNVQDMVVRDRNRPSVIVWGTRLNESNNNTTLYTQTRQLADSLDGTRPTSGAMRFYSTTNWAQDLYAYDDYHSSNTNTDATLLDPIAGVPYLVTEAVGALDGAPLYRWVDTEAVLALQAKMHAQVHNLAHGNTGFSGLLGWCAVDYASLNTGNRIWHNVKWPGVLDTFRVPKPGAAFYRSQVDPATAVVILPVFFWDFGASSPPNGPGAGSMIATNCDRLEIYVGGSHLATATPDTNDYPNLSHPPALVDLTAAPSGLPDLHVDGYLGSALVGSLDMSCDPSRDGLALVVEDSAIVGDGSDMTRFTFRAVDAYGNQRPYPAGDVALSLSGPATLLAENPFSFAAYGGVGGGFIRSQPGGSGTVTVSAVHPTLGSATAALTVTAQPASATAGGAGLPSPPATGTVPQAAPSPPRTVHKPKPTPAGPTSAQVRAALGAVLSPTGGSARLAGLVKRGGYTFTFTAPSSGKLVIDWFQAPASAHAKKVLVASAAVSVKKAGKVSVKLRLTKAGLKLLRRAKRQRLTATASFTPMHRSRTGRTRIINLRR